MDNLNARAAQARSGSPYLNTAQAAYYLGLSPRTLERMRWLGCGPAYRKYAHRVRYLIVDLDNWSAGRQRRSTTENPGRSNDRPHA
jgi:hypothetical protein